MKPVTPLSGSRFGRWKLGLMTTVLVIVVMEGLSYGVLALLPQVLGWEVRRKKAVLEEQQARAAALLELTEGRHQLDSLLGWLYRPGFSAPGERINSQGARSTREYTLDPGPGTSRITAYGDSFVYGTEIDVDSIWSAELERLLPGVEVMNFGVGGYGTDQAFLRYLRNSGQYREELVLIGFAPVNLRRSVNVYRRFISDSESVLIKPRFGVEPSGALRLTPNPFPTPRELRRLIDAPRTTIHELGRHDYWYAPLIWRNPLYDLSASVRLATYLLSRAYKSRISSDRMLKGGVFNPNSEAFDLQIRILKEFVDSVSALGAESRIVIFPDRTSIERFRRGAPTIYSPLAEALKASGIDPLDLVIAFANAAGDQSLDSWFAPGGHYSSLGNRVVASAVAALADSLREGLTPRAYAPPP